MGWEDKFSKGFHVEELKYYYSSEHSLMGLDIGENTKLDNIGENGRNLTIAVLSMNRSNLTIRLMRSIQKFLPEFKGEFLIGDNGSEKSEKVSLYRAMKEMPYRCRMLEFGINLGVAGGRNCLFKEVKTDWILSADNDLYFVGNPLKKIQNDISILGCHFLGLPILNENGYGTGIYGGHIYIENISNKVSIGGGSVLISPSVEINMDNPPFLCTFVPGGASVMKKNTFFECGAYDDGMFIGFEDVEFSLRIYQRGLKIGACGMASIIHDHPKPEKNVDAMYEKRRFSSRSIENSGKYFENKHGFSVWNPETEKWVEGRLNELLALSDTKHNANPFDCTRIALVIDARGWALDHIAEEISSQLTDFKFKKIYLEDVSNLAQIFLLADDCDLIHFFWRPIASTLYETYVQEYISSIGLDSKTFYNRYIKPKWISVAIYDHLLLEGKELGISRKLFSDKNSIIDSYVVSSIKLNKLYNDLNWINKAPMNILSDGVNTKMFHPINIERLKDYSNRPIKVGWAGNSKWQVDDLKGINTIIKPAIEILKKQGYDVELVTTDRFYKTLPFEDMPIFYSEIDIYVCASLHEGTPNPVLEAMACGVPVISTDVGLVPELFGEFQKEFILAERSVKCLVEKLKMLLDSPEKLLMLSKENIQSIMSWDWEIKVKSFSAYFKKCLKINDERHSISAT